LTHTQHSPNTPLLPCRSAGRQALGLCVWALGMAWGTEVAAQAAPGGPGIYVCVDAKGRRITSDRPIPECLDREQRELSSTGATRRVVPASLTEEERERLEAKAREDAVQRAKVSEDRRRDRALIARYPSQRKHDEERAKQLAQLEEVAASIHLRSQELNQQRSALDMEMEFYKATPSKAPAWLLRRIEDNNQQMEGQKRLLANQAVEKQRLNARFDEELTRLRQLWSPWTGQGK